MLPFLIPALIWTARAAWLAARVGGAYAARRPITTAATAYQLYSAYSDYQEGEDLNKILLDTGTDILLGSAIDFASKTPKTMKGKVIITGEKMDSNSTTEDGFTVGGGKVKVFSKKNIMRSLADFAYYAPKIPIHDIFEPPIKSPPPPEADEEVVEKKSPSTPRKEQEIDWRVDVTKKPEVPIRPLNGLVVPHLQVFHWVPKGEQGAGSIVDLATLWGIISVKWDDNDQKYINQITIECVHQTDFMFLPQDFQIYVYMGAVGDKAVYIGSFYLSNRKTVWNPTSHITTLYFTAIPYQKSNATEPIGIEKKDKTIRQKLKEIAEELHFKLDIKKDCKGADDIYNPPVVTTQNKQAILRYIVKEKLFSLKISGNTFIIDSLDSSINRVNYMLDVSLASSFSREETLTQSFDGVQVISDHDPDVRARKKKKKQAPAGKSDKKGEEDDGGTIIGRANRFNDKPTLEKAKKIMTHFEYVKDKKEANALARKMLYRVNANVDACTVHLHNVVIWAGHNIVLYYNDGQKETHHRIVEVSNSVSPEGWTCRLNLQSIPYNDGTKKYENSVLIEQCLENYYEALDNFEKITHDGDKLDHLLTMWHKSGMARRLTEKAIGKSAKSLSETEFKSYTYGILNVGFIEKRRYPISNDIISPMMARLNGFYFAMKEVDACLGKYGSSLEKVGKKPKNVVDLAFKKFADRAKHFYAGISPAHIKKIPGSNR